MILALAIATPAFSQGDSLKMQINDYSMFGIQYGVGFVKPSFNPVRDGKTMFSPYNFGIMYTKYSKMFGYMPYFGFQAGLFYNHEGYLFEPDEKGYTDIILGAQKAVYSVVELPIYAHFHVDFWKMKIIASLGVYAGYRLDVERSSYLSGEYYLLYNEYEKAFHPNEYRFTYGARGGAGFALVFDPIEIHFMGWYKYSFQPLHKPNVNGISLGHDDRSKYYYKWTYPTEIAISVGVFYQLTRREGYTHKQLKDQAREEALRIIEEANAKLEEKETDNESVTETPEIPNEEISSESR